MRHERGHGGIEDALRERPDRREAMARVLGCAPGEIDAFDRHVAAARELVARDSAHPPISDETEDTEILRRF